MAGVYITKGMRVGIKDDDLKITVDENGKFSIKLTPSVHFDVLPTWIKLAQDHLTNCTSWYNKRQESWKGGDEDLKRLTLENEFEASMQVVIAMAIAFDSFYGTVKGMVSLPKGLIEKWKTNRTARYIQISETLRRAFYLNKEETKRLKLTLKQIFHFRDMAIHPKGEIEHPIIHPDLGVGVEWRFVCFSFNNARLIVEDGLKRLVELLNKKGLKNKHLIEYCSLTLIQIENLQKVD